MRDAVKVSRRLLNGDRRARPSGQEQYRPQNGRECSTDGIPADDERRHRFFRL